MKWSKEDIQKYLPAKEYIDTVILPLQAFQFNDDVNMDKDAFQLEVLNIYAKEIEKELSGRVMLAPTYFYTASADADSEINRLNTWVAEMLNQPFKEIFLFTFDNAWKKYERDLNAHVLWFPGMKTGDIHTKEASTLIRNQVEQISELIRSYW